MNQSMLSILILAAIAVFLIVRLRNVLGTREGFERPPAQMDTQPEPKRKFEVIEGGVDHDIIDNVEEGTRSAENLKKIKEIEPEFSVSEFISGASSAYEMILMAYENDRLEDVEQFLSKDVSEAFEEALKARHEQKLTVESEFIGLREAQIIDVDLDARKEAEVKMRFVSEISMEVRNANGDLVEGGKQNIIKQKDIWTFARVIGSEDPNWQLVATGA